MTETAYVYAPRAPHPESLSDPHLSILDASGTLLAHYCQRHQCAGVYDLQARAWTLYNPMTPEEFISALPKLGVRVTDTAALQTWIDAIAAPSARPN